MARAAKPLSASDPDSSELVGGGGESTNSTEEIDDGAGTREEEGEEGSGEDDVRRVRYGPIQWGDFRLQRFLGDFADRGKEVQIEDYLL